MTDSHNNFGTIIHGGSIPGIKGLFATTYFHHMKDLNFYKRINKEKRFKLLRNIASDLAQKCKILCYVDYEDTKVVYSLVAYTLSEGILTVYFAYTKFPFRGYNFSAKLLSHLEKESNICRHAVPKKLDAMRLWKKYQRISPYYPKT